MADKTFINGLFITEKEFANGGAILKVNIPEDKIDTLAEQLKFNAKDGWVRLVIAKNRTPTVSKTSGKVISTHSLSVDDWQPSTQARPANVPVRNVGQQAGEQTTDVPF